MNGERDSNFAPGTRQLLHLAGLLFLFLNLYVLLERFNAGLVWGLWAWITAVLHQGLVAVVWRRALMKPPAGKNALRIWMMLFAPAFFVLLISRLVLTVLASRATAATVFPPVEASVIAMAVIAALAGWTFYSVLRHFGLFRALGADHFVAAYRRRPMVREGIFRYTPNAMYTFGTLVFLLPGIWFRSGPGMAVGLFHYCAIWIHYWATELPDMAYMYRNAPRRESRN